MEGDPGRAGACATRAGAGQARSSPLVGSSTGPLNGPGPVCCTSRAALCALGGCARARPEGESRSGCAKMRAPRRRTLRKGGRRAEAPFQGASAALSMATLAGAACVGRHELPCRHTAREIFRDPSRARVACACCACPCCSCRCCAPSCWSCHVLAQRSFRSCGLRSSTSSTSRGCAGPCFVLVLCILALCVLALPMLALRAPAVVALAVRARAVRLRAAYGVLVQRPTSCGARRHRRHHPSSTPAT